MNSREIALQDVELLVDLVAQSDVSEVVVRRGDSTVRLVRPLQPTHHEEPVHSEPEVAPPAPDDEGQELRNGLVVLSPMVGVFHSPMKPIRVGDKLKPGDLVGSIESMKLMNEVRSEVAGVVTATLAEDGSPVEFGQTLLRVCEEE